jgi:hypothetical protein
MSDQQPRGFLARSAKPMLLGFFIVIIALLINLCIWIFFGESILMHPLQLFTNSTPPKSGADYGHFFTDLLFGGLNLLFTMGVLLLVSCLLSYALYYGISKALRLQRGRRPNRGDGTGQSGR